MIVECVLILYISMNFTATIQSQRGECTALIGKDVQFVIQWNPSIVDTLGTW